MRQAERAADDGYRHPLVPGLRSTEDARRLADELAFATARLSELASDPPGLYAEVGAEPEREEATWLAFLIAYVSPTEDDDDPFAAIRAARVPWSSGEAPELPTDQEALGPRSSHDASRGVTTVSAYRAFAARAGSQAAALAGDDSWPPERRFARAFERLALPGLSRAARFDLLVTLGRLGVLDLRAGALELGVAAGDETVAGAKRVFGIGDPLLLERRAADLARAAEAPLEALDLALWNWERGTEGRATLGARRREPDPEARERALAALDASDD